MQKSEVRRSKCRRDTSDLALRTSRFPPGPSRIRLCYRHPPGRGCGQRNRIIDKYAPQGPETHGIPRSLWPIFSGQPRGGMPSLSPDTTPDIFAHAWGGCGHAGVAPSLLSRQICSFTQGTGPPAMPAWVRNGPLDPQSPSGPDSFDGQFGLGGRDANLPGGRAAGHRHQSSAS